MGKFYGLYSVVLGSKVMNTNYNDDGGIFASDFNFHIRIDAYLENKDTGQPKMLNCITAKIHTKHIPTITYLLIKPPTSMLRAGYIKQE
jgi:hypothetical protein